MKTIERTLKLFLCILAVAGIVSAQGKDPLTGTWKLNVAKSKFPGPAPQSSIRAFEDLGSGFIYVKNDGVGAQGNKTGNRIVFKRDGKEYPIAALEQKAFVTISFTVKSQNPFTADYVTKAEGKITSTATEGLSADGKTYTVTTKATNPQGQTVTAVTVYDKQ